MKTIVIIILFFTISIENMAQNKPCLPDSLQHTIYTEKIEGKDTLFRYPREVYRLFDFKKYHYRNCLNPYTISKLRQVFRGEIDYLPQELKSSRESYDLALDTPKRVLKVKQKCPKDSLTYEMAIDTLIKESSIKNINSNISHRLELPREDLIINIGRIYLVEMIPDLEWALTQDPKIFPPIQIKLVLARMGVKKYEDYFLNFYKDFVTDIEGNNIYEINETNMHNGLEEKEKVLEYINTQESWELLLKENLNPNFIAYYTSDERIYKSISTRSPKYWLNMLSKEDKQKHDLLYEGIQYCFSTISPQDAKRKCPNIDEIKKFDYEIQKKYIKDFVMPYDYKR